MLIVSNALILLECEVVLVEAEDTIRHFPTATGLILHHRLMLLGDLTLYIMDTASGHQITSSLLHAAWYFIASCCLVTSLCTSWTQHQATRLLHHCFMLPGDLTLYIMDTASGHQITSSLPHAAW